VRHLATVQRQAQLPRPIVSRPPPCRFTPSLSLSLFNLFSYPLPSPSPAPVFLPCRQNCNAGFLVCSTHRGARIGNALGRAYLVVGPRLGYRASVFNLVYVNNTASLAIWDRLGFTRAGLGPFSSTLS